MPKNKVYSIPTLKRLPDYLHELRKMRKAGIKNVPSPTLAQKLGVDMMVARKDIEVVGICGSPGVGYRVDELIDGIEGFLGWKNTSEAFLAGTGEMGRAFLGYDGFAVRGLRIIAAFERKSEKKDTAIHDIPVFDYSEFKHLAQRLKIRMGILCVPDDQAQEIAELMTDAGILAIWNLTEQTLRLPENIICQKANFAGDLAVLSVKLGERLKELNEQEAEKSDSGGKETQ